MAAQWLFPNAEPNQFLRRDFRPIRISFGVYLSGMQNPSDFDFRIFYCYFSAFSCKIANADYPFRF